VLLLGGWKALSPIFAGDACHIWPQRNELMPIGQGQKLGELGIAPSGAQFSPGVFALSLLSAWLLLEMNFSEITKYGIFTS
jgi:hypothetical protein